MNDSNVAQVGDLRFSEGDWFRWNGARWEPGRLMQMRPVFASKTVFVFHPDAKKTEFYGLDTEPLSAD